MGSIVAGLILLTILLVVVGCFCKKKQPVAEAVKVDIKTKKPRKARSKKFKD